MKRIVFILLASLICFLSYGQKTTFADSWSPGTTCCGSLQEIELRKDGVLVTIKTKVLKDFKRFNIYSSRATFIITGDPRNGTDIKLFPLTGVVVNGEVKSISGNWGWDKVKAGTVNSYQLFFKGKFPAGITNIGIYDYGDNGNRGYSFWNRTINNPRQNYFDMQSEEQVKKYIDAFSGACCGIYEAVNDGNLKLACIKDSNNDYYLIYLDSPPGDPFMLGWKLGDIKAKLRPTASGVYVADWYDSGKNAYTRYVAFDDVSMRVVKSNSKNELTYLKTYPINNVGSGKSQSRGGWTGTGFALNDGYIVTNHHVVEGASKIVIQGVNGSTTEYKAEVVSVDKNNDLALIRITDYRFPGFGILPYSVKDMICDVGADIFVLGYPLTSYMGEEIKLTNGIISSRSGYQGDISTYQISAPIQPGNSGGPMFDSNGNIVGIVNAGIPGAENVGYAIKTPYLRTLVNSSVSTNIMPAGNRLVGKSLSEKVKVLRNYVFFIKCE